MIHELRLVIRRLIAFFTSQWMFGRIWRGVTQYCQICQQKSEVFANLKGCIWTVEVFYVPQTPYVNLSLGRGKERWIVGIGSVAESWHITAAEPTSHEPGSRLWSEGTTQHQWSVQTNKQQQEIYGNEARTSFRLVSVVMEQGLAVTVNS